MMAEILVPLAVIVLIRVLAVRVCVLLNGFVAPAKVAVGQGDEHQDQQDHEHYPADNEWRRDKRREFLMFDGCGDGRGDLLEQHVLP
jgi:hypothetical protein